MFVDKEMVRNASPFTGNRLKYYTGEDFNTQRASIRSTSQSHNHFMEEKSRSAYVEGIVHERCARTVE